MINIDNFIKIAIMLWFVNQTWSVQVKLGNYLKHTRPNSWLRKIWWSMCDQDGICELCDLHISRWQINKLYKTK